MDKKPTKQTTAAELRNELINRGVIPQVANAIKGKYNLANYLLSIEGEENLENDVVERFIMDDNLEQEKTNPNNAEWTEYILGKLRDDEKDKGYPKTAGLRRILESEITPIRNVETTIVQAPSPENGMTATVKVRVTLINGMFYDGAADARKDDLKFPYNLHLTALAETRASGRAFRNILRLNTATAEEVSNNEDSYEDNTLINRTQIMLLEQLCVYGRLNINIKRFLQELFGEKYKTNIYDYTHEEALIILKKLQEYQADINKIPTNLLGYSVDWK